MLQKPARPFVCSHCGKSFVDENARYQHTRNRHPNKSNPKPVKPGDEPEQSLADLAVEIEIAKACGEEHPMAKYLNLEM